MHAIAHEPTPIRGVNHLSRRLYPLKDGPLHYGPECHWEDIALEWKRENSADFRAIGHEWSLADLSRMSPRGSADLSLLVQRCRAEHLGNEGPTRSNHLSGR
ncbi:unannotated protein [freshwater metagenome]|uniref:Unannotated protein n=1 Tax=freshwater metagenome TaxID=449393 RepID=A0A6J6H1A1_9ZZZZ